MRGEYGDILKHKKGNIVIGINHENNSDLNVIGKTSLHRQLVERYGKAVSDEMTRHSKEEMVIPYLPEGGKSKPSCC